MIHASGAEVNMGKIGNQSSLAEMDFEVGKNLARLSHLNHLKRTRMTE